MVMRAMTAPMELAIVQPSAMPRMPWEGIASSAMASVRMQVVACNIKMIGPLRWMFAAAPFARAAAMLKNSTERGSAATIRTRKTVVPALRY